MWVEKVFTPPRMNIIIEACSSNRNITPQKIRATIAEAMMGNPKLAKCTPVSVFRSALLACRLDLDASGYHNGASFIDRWNSREQQVECSLQMGYGAMVDLATRDGRIRSFTVAEVYDCDEFDYRLGTTRMITHVPSDERPPKSVLTHCYAIAWYPDNGYEFVVMTRQEIERIRDTYSATRKDGSVISKAWNNEFGQMGCKTALHRLVKRLPVNPILGEAIERSHVADGMILTDNRNTTSPEVAAGDKALGEALAPAGQEEETDQQTTSDEPPMVNDSEIPFDVDEISDSMGISERNPK